MGGTSELNSAEKSKVMIVNRSEDKRDTVWRLEENKLEQMHEYKYTQTSVLVQFSFQQLFSSKFCPSFCTSARFS